jgi:hypothetical protein
VVVALTVLIAMLWTGVGVAKPQLAYVNGHVYLRAVDGVGSITTIHPKSAANEIFYSPGGQKLAIQEGRYDAAWTNNLEVYDISKHKLTTVFLGGRVHHDPRFQTWSPNERYLIYTRSDYAWAYEYDTKTGTKTPLTVGDSFTWSPNGATIAITRGAEIWLMAAPKSTAVLLKDMSIYGAGPYTLEWADDSSAVIVGYTDGSSVKHVFSVNVVTKTVSALGTGPWGWDMPKARTGNWAATYETPARLGNNAGTWYTVGPNKATTTAQSVSSDGQWVSLFDWWGGSGQWDVWTCRAGQTPKRIATGLWNAVRPAPLATLTRPAFPAWVRRNQLRTATGTEFLATDAYPGQGIVKIEVQKRTGSTWQTRYTKTATLTGTGSKWAYSASFRLTPKGVWRMRAVRPGSASCRAIVSLWRYFRVK